MGWTVLDVAFGIVALWLLGEVLLQYKARLRWRLLAFVGFTTVVVGVVLLSSVIVICLGAVAFGVGQTFVTLSYRKGFAAGWALDGLPGLPGLTRRDDEDDADDEDDVPDDEAEEEPGATRDAEPVSSAAGPQDQPWGPQESEPQSYAPQPMPDETGRYGVYDRDQDVFAGQGAYEEQRQHYGYGQQEAPAAYSEPYGGYAEGGQQAAASYGTDAYGGPGYGYAGGQTGYGTYQDGYGGQPDDAYAAAGYAGQGYDRQAGGYDQNGYPQDGYASAGYGDAGYGDAGYGQSGYGDAGYGYGETAYGGGYPAGQPGYETYPQGQDPYAAQAGYHVPHQAAPAEGVWVPQPREGGDPYRTQSAQGYPYQEGYGYYDDQRGGY